MEDNKEVWERLTAAEGSSKQAHHRIDTIEERMSTLEKLVASIEALVTEVKYMRRDVDEVKNSQQAIKTEVDNLKLKPAKRYEFIITCLISAIVGGIGTYVVTLIFK